MCIEKFKELFLEYFKDLEFDQFSHKYKVGEKVLDKSVTGLVGEFSEKFDTDKMSMFIAKKNGISQEEVLNQWKYIKDKACELGNRTHEFGEDYIFNRELIPTTPYQEAIVKFWGDLPVHLIPVIPELRMYHKDHMYAGTADIILYDKINSDFIIADYKGFPLDTPVLTDSGFKNIHDLTYDDKVYDKDGNPCNITGISSIHHKPCLKILFDDYETIVCDEDHRWLINVFDHMLDSKYIRHSDEYITTSKEKVMTTKEIKEHLACTLTRRKPFIKNCDYIKGENKCPIDPYIFGHLVAKFHTDEVEINKKVLTQLNKRGYTEDIQLNDLHLDVNNYIFISKEDRLEMIRGIMDLIGDYNKNYKYFRFFIKNKSDIGFYSGLFSSLGIKLHLLDLVNTWELYFFTDEFNPFAIRQKKVNLRKNYHTQRRILDIEEVESVPTKCIEVDSPSHTYLVTKNLIVTHNTNKDLFKNYKGKRLLKPFDFLLDSPFNKYQIQLSYYQLLFEQVGYNVRSRKLIWLNPSGNYKLYGTNNYTKILKSLT